MKFKRIFLIVLDSLGIGEAIDAKEFDDINSNTLKHIIDKTNYKFKNLEELGLLNLIEREGDIKSVISKLEPISNGKDTLTGHLEMMGIYTKKPFKTFLNGFPNDLLKEMSEYEDFKYLIGKTTPDKRMKDVEMVLRFSAFYHSTYLKYSPSMKKFLCITSWATTIFPGNRS